MESVPVYFASSEEGRFDVAFGRLWKEYEFNNYCLYRTGYSLQGDEGPLLQAVLATLLSSDTNRVTSVSVRPYSLIVHSLAVPVEEIVDSICVAMRSVGFEPDLRGDYGRPRIWRQALRLFRRLTTKATR